MPLLSALARLFPELPGSLGITVTAEPLSPEQEKFRLLDAVATLLERAAREQPIVLGIDNLQWADSASLELTMYLTVRLHRSRVALVGVTRPPAAAREQWAQDDQTGTPAASLAAARALAGLVSQGLLLPLPLAPLAPDAAAAYLHMLLPGALPPEVAQALLERSEGNPFFLEELVRALTLNRQLLLRGNTWQATKLPLAELPGSLILTVQQRLQGLSSACREVLRVAALFGRSFPLEALLHVFQRAENAADIPALLDEAARAEIIALAPAPAIGQDEADFAAFNDHAVQLSTYLFCQGIVQEVLDAEVPRHRLSGLHNAIGAALETLDAYTTPAHAAMLARHYTSGGNKWAALRWNLLAGEYAASQQAHREAIRHFRLALGFIEGGEVSAQAPSLAQVYVTIGELWFRLAEFEQAAPAFQKALELLAAQQQNEPGQETELQFARANRLMADVYRMQAKYDQALAHLQVASNALKVNTPEVAAYRPAEQGTAVGWFPGRSLGGRGSALTLERVSAEERILLLQAQALLDILFHRKKEAETALWQSHQWATQIGDRSGQAFALHLSAGCAAGASISARPSVSRNRRANSILPSAIPFTPRWATRGWASFTRHWARWSALASTPRRGWNARAATGCVSSWAGCTGIWPQSHSRMAIGAAAPRTCKKPGTRRKLPITCASNRSCGKRRPNSPCAAATGAKPNAVSRPPSSRPPTPNGMLVRWPSTATFSPSRPPRRRARSLTGGSLSRTARLRRRLLYPFSRRRLPAPGRRRAGGYICQTHPGPARLHVLWELG